VNSAYSCAFVSVYALVLVTIRWPLIFCLQTKMVGLKTPCTTCMCELVENICYNLQLKKVLFVK
jgi:hypothetical protein